MKWLEKESSSQLKIGAADNIPLLGEEGNVLSPELAKLKLSHYAGAWALVKNPTVCDSGAALLIWVRRQGRLSVRDTDVVSSDFSYHHSIFRTPGSLTRCCAAK